MNSQGHNLNKLKYISLEGVKIVYFHQWFQSEATKSNFYRLYLKLFRPRSNLQAQKYNLFKLKSSLFSDFQWPCVHISRRCVRNFIAQSLSNVKASSHIDENDPTSSCVYWRIGLQPDSLSFVNVRFKSLLMIAWMRLYLFVIVAISVVRRKILSMFKKLWRINVHHSYS